MFSLKFVLRLLCAASVASIGGSPVVFAQASAYAGVLLAGGCIGYAIGVAAEWEHGPRRDGPNHTEPDLQF